MGTWVILATQSQDEDLQPAPKSPQGQSSAPALWTFPLIPENASPKWAGLSSESGPFPASAGRPVVWFELRVPEFSSPHPDGPCSQVLWTGLPPSPAPCLPHPDSPPICFSFLISSEASTPRCQGSLHRLSLHSKPPPLPSSPTWKSPAAR